MELTNEIRAAVISELIEQTSIIEDSSRVTVETWLRAIKSDILGTAEARNEFLDWLLERYTELGENV